MCDSVAKVAPFKVGDKIKGRKSAHSFERIVSSVFQVQDEWWMTYIFDNKQPYMVPCSGFELVPDPMVARREAYIAWCKLAWPGGDTYYEHYFRVVREGRQDFSVNAYYDAIVATKHLFV